MAQEVPWREGVLALARYDHQVWEVREARLIIDEDGDEVRAWILPEDPEDWWGDEGPEGGLETVLLPGQCRRCYEIYEIDDHDDACMVAANLAAGVLPWLAPWLMDAPPTEAPAEEVIVYGVVDGALEHLTPETIRRVWAPNVYVDIWRLPNGEEAEGLSGWVAIGPDGPTLDPWGER